MRSAGSSLHDWSGGEKVAVRQTTRFIKPNEESEAVEDLEVEQLEDSSDEEMDYYDYGTSTHPVIAVCYTASDVMRTLRTTISKLPATVAAWQQLQARAGPDESLSAMREIFTAAGSAGEPIAPGQVIIAQGRKTDSIILIASGTAVLR